MILFDGVHLVSDESEEELHEFAENIGLRRKWYQDGHYDVLSKERSMLALKNGAVEATARDCVRARRKMRARL